MSHCVGLWTKTIIIRRRQLLPLWHLNQSYFILLVRIRGSLVLILMLLLVIILSTQSQRGRLLDIPHLKTLVIAAVVGDRLV